MRTPIIGKPRRSPADRRAERYTLNPEEPDFLLSFVLLIIAGAVMYAPYGPYFAYAPEFLPVNVAGPAMGLINALGAVGGFAGAYVVGALGGGAKSGGVFVFMAACLLAAAVLMLFVKKPSQPAADTVPVREPTIARARHGRAHAA